jgi:hypothetical protein
VNDKRSSIGKALSSVPPQHREHVYIVGQLGTSASSIGAFILITASAPAYAILTEIPAVFCLYDSARCSGIFLIFMFAVSVWNGGGFYIEVFGRKYVALWK